MQCMWYELAEGTNAFRHKQWLEATRILLAINQVP